MDIADVAYELISHTSKGKTAIFVVSDWATGNDWIKALADNGIEVKYQQISIEALVENMKKIGFHENTANGYAQMSRSRQHSDVFFKTLRATDYHLGKVKLDDFAKICVAAYNI